MSSLIFFVPFTEEKCLAWLRMCELSTMEFKNLATEAETADTREAFGETPFEENYVISSSFESRAKNENVETEKQNESKGLIRGKFKNFSRTCIIVLLIVLIVLILSTVTTVVTVYAPCSGNGK